MNKIMKNANKEYLECLMKFWKEHFNEIDRTKFEGNELPKTYDGLCKLMRGDEYACYWLLSEVAWWGMKEDCTRNVAQLLYNDGTDMCAVPDGYCLWEYDGKKFLIDIAEDTYYAYSVNEMEKTVTYRIYEPIKD